MKSSVDTAKPLALVLVLMLLPTLAIGTSEAAQDGLSGIWEGAIEVPNQPLGVIVTLRSASDGSWSGTIDIPAQNLAEFPLSNIAADDGTVTFAMVGVPGDPVFRGVWDPPSATISGDFEQGGGNVPFSLTRTGDVDPVESTALDPALAAEVVGDWSGELNAGGQNLRLVFHIVAAADGSLSGTMDSPDQGQNGLGLSAVAFDGTTLRVDLTYAGAYFEGDLSPDGNAIAGSWNQGGGAAPLTVTKQR
jgi:hypothetical protein